MKKKKLIVFLMLFIMCIGAIKETNVFAQEKAYTIKINKQTNHIYIYDNNKLIKEMPCSPCNTEAVDGTERIISSRIDWQQLPDGSFVRYASVYDGTIGISSAPYSATDQSKLIASKYNQIGKNGNDFNVWVNIRDAKWIYENCSFETKVIIYTDDEKQEQDTKPFTIPEQDKKAGWDPFDENDKNPWLSCKPVIEGAEDIITTVNPSEDINTQLRKNVIAYDTIYGTEPDKRTDLTDSIQIMGNIDMTKEGVYDQIYIVRDEIGNEASKVIKVKVQKIQSTYQQKKTAKTQTRVTYGDKIKLIIFAAIAVFLVVRFVFNKE